MWQLPRRRFPVGLSIFDSGDPSVPAAQTVDTPLDPNGGTIPVMQPAY